MIEVNEIDPVAYVLEQTKEKGADFVFECAGGSEAEGFLAGFKTIRQAFKMVKVEGTVVQISHPMFGKSLQLNISLMKGKCVNYVFPNRTSLRTLQHAIHLVSSKKVNVNSLISHRINGLENLLEAFEITTNKKKYQATNPAQLTI
ncbi:MAG: hypothetical protein ACOWWO_14500 [Peptococcaceae bacterium]